MSDDLVFGLHAVGAALARDGVTEVWVLAQRHDQRLDGVLKQATKLGVNIHQADKRKLDELAGSGKHQGVVARLSRSVMPLERDLDSIVAEAGDDLLLLVLDGVQDPHNLGACLRSANAAGAHAVVAPRDRAVAMTPVVRKVASGAAEETPFVQVTNLARALRDLKEAGVQLVGTDDQADDSLYALDYTLPTAIVMGGEGEGMRRLTRENCDFLVKLPMAGSVSSLNVSVAAGVCLFEAVRQRMARRGR
jgi:23S rRNA (guanosine2251-2'-O)-methyltransferase